MADNPIAVIPGRALPLAQRVKKMLGITTWSELTKGDEPYFGF